MLNIAPRGTRHSKVNVKMPMPKHTDPPSRIHVTVPSTVIAQVDLILFDPVLGRPHYSARSALITNLLRAWLEVQKGKETSDERTNDDPRHNPDGVPAGPGNHDERAAPSDHESAPGEGPQR